MIKKLEFNKEKLISILKDIHKELFEINFKIFEEKYKLDINFKNFIDKEYTQNGIQLYSNKSAYTIINKIIVIKICEDKGIIISTRDIDCRLKLWIDIIINYPLEDILKLKFFGNDCIKNMQDQYCFEEFKDIMKRIIDKMDMMDLTKGNILGDIYEEFMDENTRKNLGQFYTPSFIIEYILNNTIEKEDIIKNPFVKVLDPSCGSGNFLVMAYDMLKKKFEDNLNILATKYEKEEYIVKRESKFIKISGKDYWKKENVHYHILKHCIYGADIDKFGVQLTIVNLLLKDINNFTDEINIINCDSLAKWENSIDNELNYKFWSNKYDYVIGNPPYVGHKQMSIEYKKWLLKEYSDVFKDKSDLSYCFFKRIIEVLKEGGKSSIITTRYFMESPTGKNLRNYLKNNSDIIEIIDFYGHEIFKGVGIASAIFTFENNKSTHSKIKVYKLKNSNILKQNSNISYMLNIDTFERFELNQNKLKDERWILISDEKFNLYKKIEGNSSFRLNDIAESFQGIISGCDKAFVLKKEDISKNNIELDILKNWIKNKNINKYFADDTNLMIIYSNLINDEELYKNSLKYINRYRSKLENRRECRNGIRKWYELQWGREANIFQKSKIIYPYKSECNKFAIDNGKYFYSADIYSFFIRDEFKEIFSLEYLVAILNSKIYEFYFKMFAKKMGEKIYDYYPNSIMDMRILKDYNYKNIEDKGKVILQLCEELKEIQNKSILNEDNILISYYKKKSNIVNIKYKIYLLESEINNLLNESFKLTLDDINLIRNELNIMDLEDIEKKLNKDEFLNIHIKSNKSIEYISKLYKCEEIIIEILREKYANEYGKDEPWQFYNLSELNKIYKN